MKSKYMFIIVAYILTTQIYAQERSWYGSVQMEKDNIVSLGIDPTNKQQILDSLFSDNLLLRQALYFYCGETKIYEAAPLMKQQYQNHPYTTSLSPIDSSRQYNQERFFIIHSIVRMGVDGFHQEIRDEMDSLKIYLNKDYLHYFRFAEFLMNKYQDDYGFPTIKSLCSSKVSLEKYDPVIGFLQPFYFSSHKEDIISILRNVVYGDWTNKRRMYALEQLKDIPDTSFETIARNVVKNDTSIYMRECARSLLFFKNRSSFDVIIDGIQREYTVDRHWYYDELIRSGQFWAYKYVLDILKDNRYPQDTAILKSLLNYYNIFPTKYTLITIKDGLDSLKSAINQMLYCGWLGDQSFVIQLAQDLVDAKTPLVTKADSLLCAQKIKQFQQSLNTEYKDTLNRTSNYVTVEGWKFLYYNAQYILDRLPQIPPSGYNIKLVSSAGTKLTGGALQYYDGSWKDAVNNNDGTFFINTTKKTLTLRMTYEYGTQTKSNVSISNDTIVFQTVNAHIQLQNSNGVFIDTGSVQYYAGAWRNLGVTSNGVAAKELLPANYSFRMTYAYVGKDKQQDIGTNPIVVFQTVNAAVQLKNSQGNLIEEQASVQYYSGAWRYFGITANGAANKELLPNNYSFRMTYAFASKDKQQDIGINPIVVFQTVNANVQLKNSQGNLIEEQASVQYYSGAWRDFGTMTNGVANKELLPTNYSFRMTYAYASKDKQQDIGTNATVVFRTVNATVQLQNSQGNLIDQGTVQYYSGAWRTFGTTINGTASKELLSNNFSFRMTHEYISVDKSQDISTNNTVNFSTVLCTVRVRNVLGQMISGAIASYYSGAWRQIGNTMNGEITKELLPVNLTFRVKYGTQQQDKQQNLSTNTIVEFTVQ